MKKLIILPLLIFSLSLFAQSNKKIEEASFGVTGNCEMCKARIELAASITGVKQVDWDKQAQTLKVIYRSDKVDINEVKEAIAKAGHDTEGLKASEENYKKLPHCCAYRENFNVH